MINYCDLLLKYHAIELWEIFKIKEIDFRVFATSWIMTLFVKYYLSYLIP